MKAQVLAAGLFAFATASTCRAASIQLVAFDDRGSLLTFEALVKKLARADEKSPDPAALPLWAFPLGRRADGQRLTLASKDGKIFGSWDGAVRATLELVWPVAEDGYNAVAADREGRGFGDGDIVFLDDEIALTQYRKFKESWKKRISDWQPLFKPDAKAKELADTAKDAMAAAAAVKTDAERATAYQKALHATALAQEKTIFQHGLQHAQEERRNAPQRFGLTLDESLLNRLDDREWIAEAVRRSGANWVRLVFHVNPKDFTYASLRSFNEYDGIVADLLDKKINVMGSVLDTTQWSKSLTPPLYAERVKNLVLHYRGKISSWEVGNELNGDWLGGAEAPFSIDQVYAIYAAGAAKVKELDPQIETVATLYAWEETAPSRDYALSGWLADAVKRGFNLNLDVVGISLQPEDNPSGMAFERTFDTVADALPRQKIMLSSLGYVEKETVNGYWWLTPDDVDNARKDLVILYVTASCAMPRSLCGGFWWQTLDQMIPPGWRKSTSLYSVWRRTLEQLGRQEVRH